MDNLASGGGGGGGGGGKINLITIAKSSRSLAQYFSLLMVFNATFNNISVISWRLVLLAEETEVPGENHRPVASP